MLEGPNRLIVCAKSVMQDAQGPPFHSSHSCITSHVTLENVTVENAINHGGSFGLLGYMYALGLGVEKNLDTAHEYFVSASIICIAKASY